MKSIRNIVQVASVFATVAFVTNPSYAEPLTSMQAVGNAILTCWDAPPGVKGTVAMSFSFKRDGSLIGEPRPTSIMVPGDDSARQQFIASAIAALKSCMPLTFAPDLAQGIAGQVFTMQFVAPKQPGSNPMVDAQ